MADATSSSPQGKHSREVVQPAVSLTRNTTYNLLGAILPMPVALLAVPTLIGALGIERFGVLTMAWLVLGYFAICDIGIGRSVTKFVAEYLAQNQPLAAAKLAATAFTVLLMTGAAGALMVSLAAPWITKDMLHVPDSLHTETLYATYALAACIPVILVTSVAGGILEARMRFGTISLIRVTSSVATYLIPLMILPFTHRLDSIVIALIASKMAMCILLLYYCSQSLSGSLRQLTLDKQYRRQLLGFGGWVSLGNVLGSTITYADRLFIASMLTMAMVSYYATPFEIMARLALLPGAFVSVLFPVLSGHSGHDRSSFLNLHARASKYILAFMAIPVLGLIVYAEVGLSLWVDPEFSHHSAAVLQILSASALISALSRVSMTSIHALGRPDIPAKFYLILLPATLVCLYSITGTFGILGVAWVLLARVLIEQIVLAEWIRKHSQLAGPPAMLWNRTFYFWMSGVVAAGLALSSMNNMFLRTVLFLVCIASYVVLVGFFLFDDVDRDWVRRHLRMTGVRRGTNAGTQ